MADKIPVVDHALSAMGTVTRPLAGILAAGAVFSHADPAMAALAGLIVGAPTALAFHAAQAGNPADGIASVQAIVQRLMPADIIALYLYSPEADHLVATVVVGAHAAQISGTTMPIGQRLTGWVAANRQPIVNSDAALDLGNLTLQLEPPPQTCLSAPICADGDMLGVVTIYSTRRQPFTDGHVPVLEVLAGGLARLLRRQPSAPALEPPPYRTPDYAPDNRVH